MTNDTPKLPSKVTIYIRKENRADYNDLVSTSERSASEIVNDALFGNARHDKELKIIGAKLLAAAALVKTEIQSQGLMSEEIADELKLIRTALMQMMGRRS